MNIFKAIWRRWYLRKRTRICHNEDCPEAWQRGCARYVDNATWEGLELKEPRWDWRYHPSDRRAWGPFIEAAYCLDFIKLPPRFFNCRCSIEPYKFKKVAMLYWPGDTLISNFPKYRNIV